MTNQDTPPEAEAFCSLVRDQMETGGRKWTWLAGETDIHVNTLRSQIISKPSSLKYATSKRVATALGIPQWVGAE